MPFPTPLVHPRLVATLAASGRFPERVTIRENNPTRTASGQPVDSWVDLPDHVDLAAQIAAADMTPSKHGTEHRTSRGDWVEHTHVVALAGNYPAVDETMRAVSGGRSWKIVLAAIDSAQATTRLLCRVVDETGADRT